MKIKTKTTPEQYDLYLKLLEEDEIFRKRIPPMENPEYIEEKWTELANRLNNCEFGAKLSPNLWKMRLYKWKYIVRKKWKRMANDRVSGILGFTAQEKKAIGLWKWKKSKSFPVQEMKTEETETVDVTQTSGEDEESTPNNKKISIEQFDIYLKLLEEDKIFRMGIPPKDNSKYIVEKWTELSNQLNKCKSGPKYLTCHWQQKFWCWRRDIRCKYRNIENDTQKYFCDLNPREKKAFNLLWGNHDEQQEIRAMKAARASDKKKVKLTRKPTTFEQFDIYLKLLEEDKIFRIGIPPKENPQYIAQKWEELSKRLNNCESGEHLSPTLWKKRLNKIWKGYVKRKWRDIANGIQSGILVLTEQEKKAIDLWQKAAQESKKEKVFIKRRRERTTFEQFDIYLKLLEEDKIFRIGIPPKENPQYIAQKWEELSKRLNNCESGENLSPTLWKKRLNKIWKGSVKRKWRDMANGIQSGILVLTEQEKKAIDLWQKPAQESKKEKVKLIRKPTTCEQFDIYLKLLEDDKIFRIGTPPRENPHYIAEKWDELSNRLNNCESGAKLSSKLWKERLDTFWKSDVRKKWSGMANDVQSGIFALTEQEKKAIDLWEKAEQESYYEKENIKKTTFEQYAIYLELLEEDKIFRIGIPPKGNTQYIAQKWEELSNRLNNCESGPKLSPNLWEERLDTFWKSDVKKKWNEEANGIQSGILVLTEQEQKAIDLWQKAELEFYNEKENIEKTTFEQYSIYLKLLEEDKIFRIGIPPRENPQYITKKWEELSIRLNNCESGAKLSPNLWEERLNKSWRLYIRQKCVDVAKGIQSGILVLTEEEKKAIDLWQKAEQEYNNEQENINKTTFEQYAIYLKLLEEDKIFRIDIPPKGNPQYIAQKWEELSNRLNYCESGPKLSTNLWEKRIYKWKNDIKKKWRESANGILVLTEQEKKAIALWQKATQESSKKKANVKRKNTSPEQYDMYLKLLEEDKIFRKGIPPKGNPKYIEEKWAELSKRLNKCKTGGKLSPELWEKRLDMYWKDRIKMKCKQMANSKRRSRLFLTRREKKMVELFQIDTGTRIQSPYLTKYSNDRNADSPSADSSANNTAEMSPVTQTPMHEMVHQISQSYTPEPFTITLSAEPSTDIEEPTSTTVDDKTLVPLQTESPLESSIAIQQLEPPESLSVFEKPTELSEPEMQKIDQSLIKLFLSNFQPISILENKGFLEYSYNLQPLYTVPNRKLLLNHMITKYQEAKQKLLGVLQNVSYVAVTTDMWTSGSNRTFLALTSYFIFNNKLKSAFLSLKEIPEMHTADSLAEAILTTLEEWAISTKVVTIITNNGANIKKAIENLKIDHHPCVVHTFNQCVTDAIKEASELSALLKKCRSLVASECLKQTQKRMGLPELKVKQDVDTRWNSSLMMLNRLLELKQPLSAVISPFSNAPKFLNAYEWDIIRDCASILTPLELMIEEFSAEKYLTMSSIIPLIRGLQSTITKELTISSCGCHFKTALLDLLRERLEILEMDQFCAKATFLDAKFKNVVFSIKANAENVKKAIMDEISVNISKRNFTTSTKMVEERKMNTSLFSFMREIAPKGAAIANVPSVTVNLSVEQYLNMELIDISHDPWEFWNRNEKLLPELFQLSQKYLCIPASSVASERTFSKFGDFINEARNRLGGEKLNQIVFLDSNLQL